MTFINFILLPVDDASGDEQGAEGLCEQQEMSAEIGMDDFSTPESMITSPEDIADGSWALEDSDDSDSSSTAEDSKVIAFEQTDNDSIEKEIDISRLALTN